MLKTQYNANLLFWLGAMMTAPASIHANDSYRGGPADRSQVYTDSRHTTWQQTWSPRNSPAGPHGTHGKHSQQPRPCQIWLLTSRLASSVHAFLSGNTWSEHVTSHNKPARFWRLNEQMVHVGLWFAIRRQNRTHKGADKFHTALLWAQSCYREANVWMGRAWLQTRPKRCVCVLLLAKLQHIQPS